MIDEFKATAVNEPSVCTTAQKSACTSKWCEQLYRAMVVCNAHSLQFIYY